jgi:hypothetical protein
MDWVEFVLLRTPMNREFTSFSIREFFCFTTEGTEDHREKILIKIKMQNKEGFFSPRRHEGYGVFLVSWFEALRFARCCGATPCGSKLLVPSRSAGFFALKLF